MSRAAPKPLPANAEQKASIGVGSIVLLGQINRFLSDKIQSLKPLSEFETDLLTAVTRASEKISESRYRQSSGRGQSPVANRAKGPHANNSSKGEGIPPSKIEAKKSVFSVAVEKRVLYQKENGQRGGGQ